MAGKLPLCELGMRTRTRAEFEYMTVNVIEWMDCNKLEHLYMTHPFQGA